MYNDIKPKSTFRLPPPLVLPYQALYLCCCCTASVGIQSVGSSRYPTHDDIQSARVAAPSGQPHGFSGSLSLLALRAHLAQHSAAIQWLHGIINSPLKGLRRSPVRRSAAQHLLTPLQSQVTRVDIVQ